MKKEVSVVVAILVIAMVLTFLALDYFVHKKRGLAMDGRPARKGRSDLAPAGYRVPEGVFFDGGHTWLFLEEEGRVKLGINDFAQTVIGDIEEFVTRSPGEDINKGEVVLRVRHGNRSVSFRAPFAGVIEEVNHDALKRRELIDINPMTDAWLYRVKPADTSAVLPGLHIGRAAREWLEREVQRVKVLLATVAPGEAAVGRTLQDGGMPTWGLIDYMDDIEWKKFHLKFFG